MKTRKGLTKGKSILYHILQQLGIWLAAASAACLVLYSFISIKVENANIPSGRINYDWSLFSEESSFDETGVFDYMLWNALRDIIRYNVAKSQLETDGVFDGSKVIDIRAFVNRRYGEETQESVLSESDKYQPEAAQYYLQDLIKWDKYGINYEIRDMAEEEFVFYFGSAPYNAADGYLNVEEEGILHDYLGDGITLFFDGGYISTEGNVYYYEELYLEAMDGGNEEQAGVYENVISIVLDNKMHDALADILLAGAPVENMYFDDNGNIRILVNMLEERYQIINDKSLKNCVRNWTEYVTYCNWVQQTVEDLSYNYNEYLGFQGRYSAENSNIAYHFEMSMMGETVRVSNLSLDTWEGLDEYYRENYGRYMIYRPENMIFESNMGTAIFNEQAIFDAFSRYEYAYPETARIWLGVDTSYPLPDFLAEVDNAYSMLHPFAYPLLITGAIGLLLWFVLLLFLSVKTGWRAPGRSKVNASGTEEREAELILNWFDDIPTELAAGMGAGLAVALFYAGMLALDVYLRGSGLDIVCAHRFRTVCLAGGYVLLCSLIFCLFWYSLLRRIKAHTLWQNSLFRLLWQKVVKRPVIALKRLLLKLYDNSGIFFRNLFILGGIMFLNLALGFFFCRAWWFRYRDVRQLILMFLLICFMDACIFSIWFVHHLKRKRIIEGIVKIREGEVAYQIPTSDMHGENKQLAEAVNSIGAGIKAAVETSMKDERLKADLITNVSHDIKTPLTSIINYVDLLKREKIEEEPVKGYIEVLENKSQRLKQLTDDLLEASKISSGNIVLNLEDIDLTELLKQAMGEFSEKFEEKNLTVMESFSGKVVHIEADSRRIWRVIENLLNNVCKYALPGTRVYLDMEIEQQKVTLSIKNISAQPLNIPAEELTERFIRGDVSRSTEGSGLGLSIAKNLTELQNGKFDIYLDGDLFKVTLTFPVK